MYNFLAVAAVAGRARMHPRSPCEAIQIYLAAIAHRHLEPTAILLLLSELPLALHTEICIYV